MNFDKCKHPHNHYSNPVSAFFSPSSFYLQTGIYFSSFRSMPIFLEPISIFVPIFVSVFVFLYLNFNLLYVYVCLNLHFLPIFVSIYLIQVKKGSMVQDLRVRLLGFEFHSTYYYASLGMLSDLYIPDFLHLLNGITIYPIQKCLFHEFVVKRK